MRARLHSCVLGVRHKIVIVVAVVVRVVAVGCAAVRTASRLVVVLRNTHNLRDVIIFAAISEDVVAALLNHGFNRSALAVLSDFGAGFQHRSRFHVSRSVIGAADVIVNFDDAGTVRGVAPRLLPGLIDVMVILELSFLLDSFGGVAASVVRSSMSNQSWSRDAALNPKAQSSFV